jgi:hypothetical protein
MKTQSKTERECSHCKRSSSLDYLISGEVIRVGVAEMIKRRDPSWSSSSFLCYDCLNLFRSEYIEDALQEEKGELTRLDLEVIASLKEQETLTENLTSFLRRNLHSVNAPLIEWLVLGVAGRSLRFFSSCCSPGWGSTPR